MSDKKINDTNVAAASPASAMVHLKDVCRLAGDRQVVMDVTDRVARKGPYPLYINNCVPSGIDEYAIDAGGTIFISTSGQIVTNSGSVYAVLEPGRCSGSDSVHALIPYDAADARYLWRIITTSPRVAQKVGGTPQLRQLSGTALMSALIPWPERSVREAYVDALDGFDQRRTELEELVPALLSEGDEAFARIVASSTDEHVAAGEIAAWSAGTNVLASDRDPAKPVRVEGPAGCLNYCDDALTDGPAIMVGPSGRHLLAHYVTAPAHPIGEMRYVQQDACQVPLSVLFFALRGAGLYDRLRLNGRSLNAPELSTDKLAGLLVCVGTPEAQQEFAPVGEDILDRILGAQSDIVRLTADRDALIHTFVTYGSLDEQRPCLEAADLPRPTGPSYIAEGVDKLAAESIEALTNAAAPGLAVSENGLRALGPLAPLITTDAYGLSAADIAWELAPLVCVRVCAEPSAWDAIVRAAAEDASDAHAALVGEIDEAMAGLAESDDLLSFLPNLSYQSSLLTADQLARWVRMLDAIDPACIGGDNVRAVFALEPGATGLPASVAYIIDEVLRAETASLDAAYPEGFETAYIPCEACEGMVDALSRVMPDITMRVQFDEFSHMLAAAIVRAVELRASRDTRGGMGACAGCALLLDDFSDWSAPLVVAALPPNATNWTTSPVPPHDPRWILGTPPRSRANYAWLQHALSHQAPGGATVLLVGNALLHSTAGSEKKLREKLAASGRVRLVVALPGRIFSDWRPAMSLMVLGDPDPEGACLMVDALDMGETDPDAPEGAFTAAVHPDGSAERVLPDDAAKHIAQVCSDWIARGEADDEPGFACLVHVDDLKAHDGALAPWMYL